MAKGNSSCCCSKRLFYLVFTLFWMVAILLFQGTVLNFYVINHFNNSNAPYFLFIADFVCLCLFVGTLLTAYNYLRKIAAMESNFDEQSRTGKKSKFGVLPLSYISWLLYASFLSFKIMLIFSSTSLLRSILPIHTLGPQLLKVTMGLSSLVFLLLLEGHDFDKRGSARYSYITSVCAKTGIELLDSVAFLSILLDEHSTELGFVKDFILGISAFNFFLPAIKLYQLSFPVKVIDKRTLLVSVGYYLLHLILVDIPFLVVRLYLWLVYRDNASMFLMKNILNILLTLRGMYPDLVKLWNRYLWKSPRAENNAKTEEIALKAHGRGDAV